MNIEVLNPKLAEPYEEYLLSKNYSLLYYGIKYKDFIKRLLGCNEEYLLVLEKNIILGVLPLMYHEQNGRRVYNSLPYYGSNGGIIADNSDSYGLLADTYNELISSSKVISATIISNPLMQQKSSLLNYTYTDYRIGQLTNLSYQSDAQEELWTRIDASARRNIKRARREGVTVEIEHSRLDTLQSMHQENIRSIGGIPKTDKFFSLVPEYFKPGQDFDLYVAKKDGNIIAGLLTFYFNQTVEYYTPAIDSAYRSLQPLSLILFTAMINAARQDFKWWNFGGTWESQIGVYRFKRKWAAVERHYYYYTQLNDKTLLSWPRERLLSEYPNFYVVPFLELKTGEKNE